MFKLGSNNPDIPQRSRKKRLWGRDFDIVTNGLDEKQVIIFVEGLMKESEDLLFSKTASILKTARRDAEQIAASIKLRARIEAEEKAAKILSQGNKSKSSNSL